MTNEEETKVAIEYLTELRDSRQKVLPNEAPYYEAEKDMDIFNIAIKALEESPIVEKIVTKGGMTLALRKPDREISDFANVIADMLGDINVRELKDKFNTITFTDTNTGCIVKYCRVDVKEEENEDSN